MTKLQNLKMKNCRANILKYSYLLVILSSLHSAFAAPKAGEDSSKSYPAQGIVEKIAPDLTQATINHEAIPGYMAAMTMDFPVQNTNELKGISPGDQITFTLVIGKKDGRIENIHRTGQTAKVITNPALPMTPELQPGDPLPDGTLITEDGQTIHFSDLRGKAVAFTFFFTRCPMPNYCPLMNRNFAAARDLISAAQNAPTNWEFLSISFDPENDTPGVLTSFGGFYRHGDSSHWLFAAAPTNTLATLAPSLNLMVVHQGSSISHNLRTVVLDTHGRIYRQFDGNQWTPKELADTVLEAARQ